MVFFKRIRQLKYIDRLKLIFGFLLFPFICIIILIYGVNSFQLRSTNITNTYMSNYNQFTAQQNTLFLSLESKFDFIQNCYPFITTADLSVDQTILQRLNTTQTLQDIFDALMEDQYHGVIRIYSNNPHVAIPNYFFRYEELDPMLVQTIQSYNGKTICSFFDAETQIMKFYRVCKTIQYQAIIEISIPLSAFFDNNLPTDENSYITIQDNLNQQFYISQKNFLPLEAMQANHRFLLIGQKDQPVVSSLYVNQSLYSKQLIVTLLECLFMLLLTICIVWFISKKLAMSQTRALRKISDLIEQDCPIPPVAEKAFLDEFDKIHQKLYDYSNTIKQSSEKILEAKKNLLNLKLTLLQERMSPHFLYNSLSAIKMLYADDQLGQLIDSLVKYYRLNFNIGSSITTIDNELKMIEEYIKIISFSYCKSFAYHITCDNALKEVKILKGLIQPIVENAFFHGVNPTDDDGFIDIAVTDAGSDICISIKNSGTPIKTETIQAINANQPLPDSTYKAGSGYALKNIIKRLNLFCENNAKLLINNDNGTEFKLVISKDVKWRNLDV